MAPHGCSRALECYAQHTRKDTDLGPLGVNAGSLDRDLSASAAHSSPAAMWPRPDAIPDGWAVPVGNEGGAKLAEA